MGHKCPPAPFHYGCEEPSCSDADEWRLLQTSRPFLHMSCLTKKVPAPVPSVILCIKSGDYVWYQPNHAGERKYKRKHCLGTTGPRDDNDDDERGNQANGVGT